MNNDEDDEEEKLLDYFANKHMEYIKTLPEDQQKIELDRIFEFINEPSLFFKKLKSK